MKQRLKKLHDRLAYALRPRPVVKIHRTLGDYLRDGMRGSLGWGLLAFIRFLLWLFG